MEKVSDFIKENYLSIIIAIGFYGLFLYYTTQGNSLCDCESTENYKPTNSGRSSVNRFYHK